MLIVTKPALLAAVGACLLAGCSTSTVLSESTASGSGTPAGPIAGAWHGNLTENNGETFRINVTIDDTLVVGAQGGAVDYPSLGTVKGCSGAWVFNGLTDDTYRFSETIDVNENPSCAGTGDVELIPASNGTIEYSWVDGASSSTGTLSPLQ